MRVLICAVAITAVTAEAQAQSWNECRHEAQRSVTIEAGRARLLELDAGSGSLKVEGKPGLTSVIVRGRACASHEDLLDEIRLEGRRDGNSVIIRANVRDRDHISFRNNQYARLDVVMEVPAGMAANIDDGSGSMELSNLGDVDIDDGSGDILGEGLGAVRIDDGSGGIRLTDVRGRVDIEDGSGEISLRNIAGAIDIDDSSGEIDIRVARGNVRISDSSGSIRVADVTGDFIVADDGSGGINYDNVGGRVEIPRRKR